MVVYSLKIYTYIYIYIYIFTDHCYDIDETTALSDRKGAKILLTPSERCNIHVVGILLLVSQKRALDTKIKLPSCASFVRALTMSNRGCHIGAEV